MATQVIEIPGTTLQIAETSPPVVQIVSGGLSSASAGGSGITSINSETGAAQTLSAVDDTNVTLAIASASDDHEFTLGWTGLLPLSRGGTNAANAADARTSLSLGTLATQNGTLTDYALRANNLSDLASAGTARTNLGLGALAVLSTIGTAQIDARAATFPKLPSITDNRLLGRSAGSDGDMQHIVVGSGLSLAGGTLSATAAGGTVTDFIFTNANGITGNVTTSTTTPTLSLSIDNTSIALGKLATQADLTFLGNNTGGAASPLALTVAQAKTMLSLTGTNSGDVALAGENYLSIAGQVITAADINLATHVTGSLALTSIATQADATILGNNTGGASAPIALTAAQTKTLLSLNNVENTALSTWAGSGNITTVGTLVAGTWNAGIVPMQYGGTGTNLADPGADRVLFWDDSAGQFTWLQMGTNLTITGTTLDASGGGGTPGGADTQLQYNDGGAAFGGMSLTGWDDVNNTLTFGTYGGSSNFLSVYTAAGGGNALLIDATLGSGNGASISTAGGTGVSITSTGGGLLSGTATSADTNVATRVLATFGHNSSGAVANNFGARIELQLESSTTAGQSAAAFQWLWADATHAGRDSRLSFYAVNNTNLVECFRIDPAASASAIYFPGLSSNTGVLTVTNGVLGVGSYTSNKVMYANASGVPSTTTNFHFDTTNTRLGVGIASAGATFHGVASSATTNAAVNGLLLGTNTTGTPANGLGGAIFFNIETSTTADTNAADMQCVWTDITHASRTSAFLWRTTNNAGALAERFRVGGLAVKYSGGRQEAIVAKTANYTAVESDENIFVDATAGAVAITLPAASIDGCCISVWKTDNSVNAVTVSRAGSDTIEGANTVSLALQYDAVDLIADGTATWYLK